MSKFTLLITLLIALLIALLITLLIDKTGRDSLPPPNRDDKARRTDEKIRWVVDEHSHSSQLESDSDKPSRQLQRRSPLQLRSLFSILLIFAHL